jgi:hypothetical protein
MALLNSLTFEFVIILILFILATFPLHRAVKWMKGKTTFQKTLFVTFIGGVLVSTINLYFDIFGGLLAFVALIWLYKEIFRLKWWKAFMVWVLHLIFIIIGSIIMSIIISSYLKTSVFFGF